MEHNKIYNRDKGYNSGDEPQYFINLETKAIKGLMKYCDRYGFMAIRSCISYMGNTIRPDLIIKVGNKVLLVIIQNNITQRNIDRVEKLNLPYLIWDMKNPKDVIKAIKSWKI